MEMTGKKPKSKVFVFGVIAFALICVQSVAAAGLGILAKYLEWEVYMPTMIIRITVSLLAIIASVISIIHFRKIKAILGTIDESTKNGMFLAVLSLVCASLIVIVASVILIVGVVGVPESAYNAGTVKIGSFIAAIRNIENI